MALIPGYEYDIFISYAHLDNATFPGQSDGWIEQFYENLNLMLAKRFGRMDVVKIWWDSKKLDGSVLFDDSIAAGIEKSAIMICLNSSSYAASEYCAKELSLFHNKIQQDSIGPKVGHRSRIVHVLLNNINFEQWPKELSGTSGFPFHDAKESTDFGDALETTSPNFRNQMRDLRDAIWEMLTDFPKDVAISKTMEEIEAVQQDDAFTVYLADVADTLRTAKKRIGSELNKRGFRIIESPPPPNEASEHAEATLECIRKSQLTIHLLDEYRSREILGDESNWYNKKQCELALTESIPQLIWMPDELEISELDEFTEPAYKEFLEKIEAGTLSEKDVEYIRSGKSSLTRQIIEYADRIQESQQEQMEKEGPLAVLLDTHNTDHMYALDLSKTLLEHNITPYINPQEDDPLKNIELLGNRMSQVKKLVFLYGNVSKDWVLERMNAALQLILKNNYPIEDFFVYMAPPHKEADAININQRLLKVNIVDGSAEANVNPASLDEFLKSLKAS